jgi:ATP-dependent RNA helicase DeaD
VELPAKLPHATLKALEKTRIAGVRINLQPDRAPEKNRHGGRGAPRREHKG